MSTVRVKSWQRAICGFLWAFLVLSFASAAFAAGRIEWKNKTLKPNSENNAWNIEVTIYLPNPPDVPSVPVKFTFDQQVYFEQSMVDGDQIVKRDVPISGKQPIVEGVDIGFLDPRSGTIQKRTRFSFKIHRDHGFECGIYKITVRDTRNNQIIGQPTTVTLGGENEVIDRRSIVFSGEKKKEKKPAETTEAQSGGDGASKESTSSESETAAGNEAAAKTPENELPPEEDADQPQEIKEKPGGCGCRLAQTRDRVHGGLWLALGLVGLSFRRRRLVRPS
jgi:MYXO-CTERM domain-containing protein